jgi:hypothetical protein
MFDDDTIKKTIEQANPQLRRVSQAFSQLKLQNAMMKQQLMELSQKYDDLWKVITVVLDLMPGKEMRIHQSQFLRFKEEYRISNEFDERTKEVVLRLLTLTGDEKKES